ncbi:MAG: Gldg family protein, partial [Halioglobus sp.]|nr:Gldg family protein [Halioglobus sp.]
DGTRRIVDKIDEPINLYFYYSDQATENIPSLRSYAERVREMLEEISSIAGDRIRLQVLDPQPFSEEEDRAAQFGLQAVQLPNTPDSVYFGLAGTNSVDNQETIAFFQPDKESFLEYDIARLISTLAEPKRPVIGLVSGISMSGGYDPQSGQMSRPWMVWQQAGQLFETRNLGTSFESIDEDIGVLWIVQPKALDANTQYAIDQFLLAGGKALIFVDPVAEADAAEAPAGMPLGMPMQGQSSDLPNLFKAWGISYSSSDVVTDAQLALQLSGSQGGGPVRHFAYLGVSGGQLNADDVTIADVGTVNLALAGEISASDDSNLDFEPLIWSSRNSSTANAARFSYLPDPSALQNGFAADGKERVIAARISGTLKTAFPDGPPAADKDGETEPRPAQLKESTEPASIILVADVDMLSDRMWVQVQSFFGQQVANAFAGNGAFVVNALESLSGSSDLIAVRSRGSFARPFTRVEELRVQADARFRETEQQLQDELSETERRLAELQSNREDSGNLLLTDEQQQEVDRFVAQRGQIRTELRAVRRDLDRSIERLGTVLKIINIGLVPLLLTVFALLAVARRKRRPR